MIVEKKHLRAEASKEGIKAKAQRFDPPHSLELVEVQAGDTSRVLENHTKRLRLYPVGSEESVKGL